MKKIVCSLLGLAFLCGLTSCDKDETTYEPKIDIVSTILIGNFSNESSDTTFESFNTVDTWITKDLSDSIVAFADAHTHTYNLSGENLDDLYAKADEKYKDEFFMVDLEDAQDFVVKMQNLLDRLEVTSAKVEIPLSFQGHRILGDSVITEATLDTLKLDISNENTFIPTLEN